ELAQYREMAAFSQFASDLDPATQKLLSRGERLTELLKQSQFTPISEEEQVVSIYSGVKGYLDSLALSDIGRFEEELLREIKNNHPQVLSNIKETGVLSEENEQRLKQVIEKFSAIFA
ncbi:MAG: F0F1 ATP synthase subunit alpha, partial [Caedimonadaceae bacterium]